ncbi:MAG: Rieske (2Fe-2S) protein [Candidatus Sumerlaea chitinivorans]|nr:Rieske (2Fe-2S) protein [Candidatus Sumerlaea chitinivorans]
MQSLYVCREHELGEGHARTFSWRSPSGWWGEGFIIRFRGQLYAYLNQCPHQPLTLDYGDGEFFDAEKQLLVCRNHGALFEPATGKCVAGPGAGASLKPLQTRLTDGCVYVELPPEEDVELE